MAACAVAVALTLVTAQPRPGLAATSAVREVAVAFTVANPGEAGTERIVRGTLYLPSSGVCTGVQLLLHGLSYGSWAWDPPGFPRQSYARAMASSGFAVVAVDQLGYGSSDRPNGYTISTEGYGAMAHQMVRQLRAGSYQGDASPAFDRVVLTGHSAGGEVARLEAGTYGDVDGLIVMAMGDEVTDEAGQAYVETNVAMAATADYVEPFFGTHERRLDFFYQYPTATQPEEDPEADPELMQLDRRLANPTPSGEILSILTMPSRAVIDQIDVPVLLVFAERDEIVPVSQARTEPARYSGSGDVTALIVPDAGHTFFLHDSGPQSFRDVRSWLKERSDVGARCRL